MSHEEPSYNQMMINAWTALSVLICAGVFGCFVFGDCFLQTGHWIWDLLRYLASPII